MSFSAILQEGINRHCAGRLREAIAFYKQAEMRNPYDAQLLSNLALALDAMAKSEEAIEYYYRAISAAPNHPVIYSNLGLALAHLERYEDAVESFVKSIEIDPGFMEAYSNIFAIFSAHIMRTDLELLTYQRLAKANPTGYCLSRIRVETSSACNLRCQHCPTGTSYGSASRAIMGMDVFDKLLVSMKRIRELSDCVLYLGGEPLLNKHFTEMCRRVKVEANVTLTSFNTNAMLLNSTICRDLAEAKIDRIAISIDGRSPEENDAIRRGSSYQAVRDNIKMLQMYMRDTHISIANTIIKRPGDPDVPVTPSFLLQDFPEISVNTTYAMKWPGLDINNSSIQRLDLEFMTPKKFCIMPFTQVAVKPNGDVTLCCYDLHGDTVMGNIHVMDLAEIWKGPGYKEIRENMLQQNIDALPDVCKKCTIFQGDILVAH